MFRAMFSEEDKKNDFFVHKLQPEKFAMLFSSRRLWENLLKNLHNDACLSSDNCEKNNLIEPNLKISTSSMSEAP